MDCDDVSCALRNTPSSAASDEAMVDESGPDASSPSSSRLRTVDIVTTNMDLRTLIKIVHSKVDDDDASASSSSRPVRKKSHQSSTLNSKSSSSSQSKSARQRRGRGRALLGLNVVITNGRYKNETGLVIRGANGYYSVKFHKPISGQISDPMTRGGREGRHRHRDRALHAATRSRRRIRKDKRKKKR